MGLDYEEIALERWQPPEPCETCSGTGSLPVRTRPWVDTVCDACCGDRTHHGTCSCGRSGPLHPDLAAAEDGTTQGAVLVCPRCAVTCACGEVSVIADSESREQFCSRCWERYSKQLDSLLN